MPDLTPHSAHRLPHWSVLLTSVLLLALIGLAICFGIPAYRQIAIVSELRRRGMYVGPTEGFERDTLLDSIGRELPTLLSSRITVDYGAEFFDEDLRLNDLNLRRLASLTNLEELDLSDTPITDAGLAELAGLKELKSLKLNGTSVSDSGLDTLAKITSLERLSLDATDITNAGLVRLAGSNRLQYLSLDGTRLNDEGLANLPALPKLEKLMVLRTWVTADGVARFRKKAPHTSLIWQ